MSTHRSSRPCSSLSRSSLPAHRGADEALVAFWTVCLERAGARAGRGAASTQVHLLAAGTAPSDWRDRPAALRALSLSSLLEPALP